MTARDRSGGVIPAVGEAIADVREKLVEEAWFGRALSPRPISEAFGIDPSDGRDPLRRTERSPTEGERELAAYERKNPVSAALGWHLPGGEQQHAVPAPRSALEQPDHSMDHDR